MTTVFKGLCTEEDSACHQVKEVAVSTCQPCHLKHLQPSIGPLGVACGFCTELTIPNDALEHFPGSALDKTGIASSLSSSAALPYCAACEAKASGNKNGDVIPDASLIAYHWCPTCENRPALCVDHAVLHKQSRRYRTHQLTSLMARGGDCEDNQLPFADVSTLCRRHPFHKVLVLCETCQYMICAVCMKTEHHRHVIASLKATATTYAQEVEEHWLSDIFHHKGKLADRSQQHPNEIAVREFTSEVHNIRREGLKAGEAVRRKIREAHAVVETLRERMQREVDKQEEALVKQLEGEQKELNANQHHAQLKAGTDRERNTCEAPELGSRSFENIYARLAVLQDTLKTKLPA